MEEFVRDQVGGEMTKAALAVSALALLASCEHVGRYDPKYFASWRIAQEKKLEGRALVLTTAKDDAYVWSGPPTGTVGSASTLTLPLGLIAREAAKLVFGDLFLGGADASTDEAHLEGYRAIMSPRITAFSYKYGWSSLFDNSSEFAMSVHVVLLDGHGAILFEKTYESNRVEVAGQPNVRAAELISPALHVAAQSLMLKAATDVRSQLVTRVEPVPSPPGDGNSLSIPRTHCGVAPSRPWPALAHASHEP